jgi:hypothetical protein
MILDENRSGGYFNKGNHLDSGFRGCVVIAQIPVEVVIPAKAGIQNLLKTLDSVSRFACTE